MKEYILTIGAVAAVIVCLWAMLFCISLFAWSVAKAVCLVVDCT